MAPHEHDDLDGQRASITDSIVSSIDVIERSPLAMAITSGAAHILRCVNAAFAHLFQAEITTLLDRPFADVLPESKQNGVLALLDRVLRTGDPDVAADQEQLCPARGRVYWTYTVWPLLDPHGHPAGLVLLVSDTTEEVLARCHAAQAAIDLQQVNEQLLLAGLREHALAETATQQALHDGLTGLPNRSLLLDRLEQALRITRREPSPFALLLLDLDRFKMVNDSLGHLVGDQLLIQIARRLTACLRPEDTVARLGGDEFAILLAEVSEVSQVIHITARIYQSLTEPFYLGRHDVITTASIGIVLSTPTYERPEEVLRDADIALYRAKAGGKAQYVIFDPTMHADALALAQLEADLRRAIAQEELRLHYQPIISLHPGTIIGVEALVRWQHPLRGCITPEEFLAVAEESGLIIPIEEWVLRTACAQVHRWHVAGLPPMYVTVNISARHLQRRDLRTTITQIIHQTGLAPQHLHLELKESGVMEDVAASAATLQYLTAMGMQVSMDDFGTGYSSLSYLKRLPLTTVKIDQSFVDEITSDPNAAAIAAAIIAMAHRLGLQVIAEGVETEAQLAHLRAEQCDAIQGYLVSPPLSAADMTQRLAQGHWLPPALAQRRGDIL